MDTEVSFGRWLERRRKALDLTREELARRGGCSVSALRKIEYDQRRPSRQLAELLAVALNIPVDDRPEFIRIARGELALERLRTPAPLPDLSLLQTSPDFSCPLPAPLTPLIGRASELSALRQMLGDAGCRLVTLIGPGGIGKTRLAVELANHPGQDYVHGVAFVQLASVNSASLLVPTIADALGITLFTSPGQKAQLLSHLSEKHMLLVMDNLEHLVEDAGLVAEIICAAPRVKIVCTSREPLNLRGEWIFEIRGLNIPDGDQVQSPENFDATTLFVNSVQRAGLEIHEADWAPVAAICRMVSGMPLAIELAASWAPTLSCREIARELERNPDFLESSARDLPERHRSMRAVFEHSWNLLPDAERQALARLSVFEGGFTREAAIQIAGASTQQLSVLVAKSLVQRNRSGRFQLHELIRQYTGEHLQKMAGEQAEARNRHAEYYLALLQKKRQPVQSGPHRDAAINLTAEMENLRRAWAWAAAQQRLDRLPLPSRIDLYLHWGTALEFAGRWQEAEAEYLFALSLSEQGRHAAMTAHCQWALGRLNRLRMEYGAAQAWLERSRNTLRDTDLSAALCRTLIEIGFVCSEQRQYETARTHLEESLAIARKIGDQSSRAWSIYHLGLLAWRQQDSEASRGHYLESLRLFKELDDPLGIAWSLNDLGMLAFYRRDFQQARTHFEESLTLRRAIGEEQGIALVLSNLGVAALHLNDYAATRSYFQESLALAREIGDKGIMARALNWMGYTAHIQDDLATASSRYTESLAIYRRMDDQRGMATVLTNLGHLAWDRNDLSEAGTAYQNSLDLYREIDETRNIGCNFLGLAALAARRDQITAAVLLASAADRIRARGDFFWEAIESRIHQQILCAVRARLSNAEFTAAWEQGQALSLEQALEVAGAAPGPST